MFIYDKIDIMLINDSFLIVQNVVDRYKTNFKKYSSSAFHFFQVVIQISNCQDTYSNNGR